MRQLYILSIDHRNLSNSERQNFVLEEAQKRIFDNFLQSELKVQGSVFLSTCNRIELYLESEFDVSKKVIQKWSEIVNVRDEKILNKINIIIGNEDCIEHLLGLSIGLKSAILGDDQILNQLKKAFETARNQRPLSTLLERAFQSVMRFHKQVCKDTNFRNNSVSLAYHSLKSIYNFIPKSDLASKSLLIIGAGDMAAQIIKYLPKFKFGQVAIMNRTEQKAYRLAEGKGITVVPFSQVNGQDFDVVISCIDQGRSMIQNKCRISYYIDLSAYGCENTTIDCPHIFLSQLQKALSRNMNERLSSINMISKLIRMESHKYLDWTGQWWYRRKGSVRMKVA
jgi:glutamyl-tRNA reductase